MLPFNVGAEYCFNNVCVVDAALSRPFAFARATTAMSSVSVNCTVIVAVVPVTDVVTPVTTELSDALRTCTEVTPEDTVYVMVAA